MATARKTKAKKKPARKRKPKLTPKQRAFVRFYIGKAAGNATEAARLAGYKGNDATLGAVGAENLKKPLIAAAIAAAQEKAAKRAEITIDEVLKRYWWLATFDVAKVLEIKGGAMTVKDLADIPEEARYAIASVAQTKDGVRVAFHSNTDALGKIGKHLGMFVDVHLIKGEMETLLEKLKNRVSPEEYERALEAFDAPDR